MRIHPIHASVLSLMTLRQSCSSSTSHIVQHPWPRIVNMAVTSRVGQLQMCLNGQEMTCVYLCGFVRRPTGSTTQRNQLTHGAPSSRR